MAKEDRGGGGPVGGSAKGTHMDKGYSDNKRGSEEDGLHGAANMGLHPVADEKDKRRHRDKGSSSSSDRDREREAALDLSYCLEVAATEPDISQFMEDFEATKSDEMKYRQAAARYNNDNDDNAMQPSITYPLRPLRHTLEYNIHTLLYPRIYTLNAISHTLMYPLTHPLKHPHILSHMLQDWERRWRDGGLKLL